MLYSLDQDFCRASNERYSKYHSVSTRPILSTSLKTKKNSTAMAIPLISQTLFNFLIFEAGIIFKVYVESL